jgi:hypothetical protein
MRRRNDWLERAFTRGQGTLRVPARPRESSFSGLTECHARASSYRHPRRATIALTLASRAVQ